MVLVLSESVKACEHDHFKGTLAQAVSSTHFVFIPQHMYQARASLLQECLVEAVESTFNEKEALVSVFMDIEGPSSIPIHGGSYRMIWSSLGCSQPDSNPPKKQTS
ncbi:hypothetical protein J6590_061146 [Homalodisca vitripennis]|nr:hypothetical protein J6590_061146 [Homalodisca vitripennis]